MRSKFYFDNNNKLWMNVDKAWSAPEKRIFKSLNSVLDHYYKKPESIYTRICKLSPLKVEQLFREIVCITPTEYLDNLTSEQNELALKYLGEIKEALSDILCVRRKQE